MISDIQREELLDSFNSRQLESGLLLYVKKLYLVPTIDMYNAQGGADVYKMLQPNPALKAAVEKVKSKKSLNKSDQGRLCCSVFENKEVYSLFAKSLPVYIQQLFEILVWRGYIRVTEAEKITGEIFLEESTSSYYSSTALKSELYIFWVQEASSWVSGKYKADYLLILSTALREILAEYYPKPPTYNFIPVENIPAGQAQFNGEAKILVEMPSVLAYHQQGTMKYTNSGRPNEASANRMQRSCGITEFYTNGDEELKSLRTLLMAGMLYGFKIKDISAPTHEIIKNIFTAHNKTVFTPQFVLTHIKGWGNLNFSTDEALPTLMDVFRQLPLQKWVSAQNLENYLTMRAISVKIVSGYGMANRLYFEETPTSGKSEITDGTKLVYDAYVNGVVFLLASFGLMEICYTHINTKALNKTYYSPYDGLQYFKLTPLGAYVLGLSKSYEPEYAAPKNKLHFSEDSLVILAEGDVGVVDIMLANYTEKEGNGRYRLTTAVFFKDCKSINAVETKITLFKKIVGAKLPRYWEATFAEWKANAQKIKEDITTVVFKIPAEAKELQNLIAKDTVLKALIFKAEGFYILVTKDNVAKFKQRMKEFGFFIGDAEMQLTITK